ncbi:MAG: YwaF family protein [Clostridia bacterium]|nr:YwaF family protein [Clostridia bacterium]
MQFIDAFLEQFIEMTAWEMTKPKAYGPFHLIFTFVGLAISLFAAYKLRHTGEKGNRAVLLFSGLFLMLTEVYKQLFYFYHMEDHAYNWGIFPFQLCSVPMYLCVIAAFLRPGKLRDGMYGFMTTFNLLGGIMAFIEPSGIVHGHWTLTIHAFVWHMMLIFIGAYLIASGRFAKTWKDYRSAAITFLALAALAFCINCVFWKISEGNINMFFVGPRNSSLIVFKQISEAAGWYVSTILYLPTVCLGALIVFLPAHFYAKKKGMIEKG